MSGREVRVGILTVSDAAHRGEREDTSGAAIRDWCRERSYETPFLDIVPDDTERIVERLITWCDSGDVDVVLTTGGTGFAPRDVTPEATRTVLDRLAPGMAEALRANGLEKTPYAVLSRGVVGTRARVLVANLPGSTSGVKDGLETLDPLIEHIVALLREEDPSHEPGGEPGSVEDEGRGREVGA